jgi:hypothetical protein
MFHHSQALCNHESNHMICSETTTTATTLPSRRIGWCGGNVLNASDAHASTSESAESGLGTGAGGLGAVSTGGPDLHVESRDTEFLAASGYSISAMRLICLVVDGYTPTSWAANMAAYGEDSSRSALTFMPPVTREIVSRPDRSVMWTKVSLKEAKMRATPKTSSPSRTWGPSCELLEVVDTEVWRNSYLDVLGGRALDLLLGRHDCGCVVDRRREGSWMWFKRGELLEILGCGRPNSSPERSGLARDLPCEVSPRLFLSTTMP